jgi:hypothetical protein
MQNRGTGAPNKILGATKKRRPPGHPAPEYRGTVACPEMRTLKRLNR